jgi:hypothetical protein
MISRRSILARAIGLAGATLLGKKVPVALADIHPDEIEWADKRIPDGYYVMSQCRIMQGDPSLNDPEWIEQEGKVIALRQRTIYIADDMLFVPGRNVVRLFENNIFKGVGLNLGLGEQPAQIIGNVFDGSKIAIEAPSGAGWGIDNLTIGPRAFAQVRA